MTFIQAHWAAVATVLLVFSEFLSILLGQGTPSGILAGIISFLKTQAPSDPNLK